MVENETFHDAKQHVADAHAILSGVLAVLDGLEEEFAVDTRGYALKTCLEGVERHLLAASDGFDAYELETAKKLPEQQ